MDDFTKAYKDKIEQIRKNIHLGDTKDVHTVDRDENMSKPTNQIKRDIFGQIIEP